MRFRHRPLLERAALLALAVGWAIFVRPQSLGGPALWVVIRGDSMMPTYASGDLVLVRAEPGYTVGDVVAYRVPSGELGAGRVVIHRIVGGDAHHGFVLEGDNNPAPDPWLPTAGDVVGRSWLALPALGRLIEAIHRPVIAGAAATAVLVSLMILRWGGRPARQTESTAGT